eukprot:scaffold1142_cov387-Prasinococcus_capsulatus_cf.AAC.16
MDSRTERPETSRWSARPASRPCRGGRVVAAREDRIQSMFNGASTWRRLALGSCTPRSLAYGVRKELMECMSPW